MNGVDHIDTAQFYGPHEVNRTALHPCPADLAITSKAPEGERCGDEDRSEHGDRDDLGALAR